MRLKGKTLQSFFISLLAIWMIAANGGTALYYHFCQCTGKDHLALVEIHHCHCQQASGPEQEQANSCCAQTDEAASCPVDKEGSCCKSSLFFLAKTDDYIVSQASIFQLSTDFQLFVIAWGIPLSEFTEAALLKITVPEAPPPPSRKTCLTSLGAYHATLSA